MCRLCWDRGSPLQIIPVTLHYMAKKQTAASDFFFFFEARVPGRMMRVDSEQP